MIMFMAICEIVGRYSHLEPTQGRGGLFVSLRILAVESCCCLKVTISTIET